jgi:hypothetical protein
MISAVIIASHVPRANQYAREHFSPESMAVVVYRDDTTDLFGIDQMTPVYLLDSGVVFRFPYSLAHLIEQGNPILGPNACGRELGWVRA